jgi:zinc protease
MKRILAFLLTISCALPPVQALPPVVPAYGPLKFNPVKPERYTLPNGLVVYLLENHELPLIQINVLFHTGTMYEPADKIGLGGMFAQTWTQGGTQTRKPEEVARFLERKAAGIGFGMDMENGAASLNCRTRDFDDVFALFIELLMKPGFAKDQLELAKAQAQETLRRRNDDPEDISRREFRGLMYGKSHPYARLATPKTVNAIKREDLLAWHAQMIVPNGAFLGISGDFDSAAMKKKLQEHLGGWAKKEVILNPPMPAPEIKTKRLFYIQRPINQSQIRIGYPSYPRHHPDSFAWSVFNELWGGGATSRLFRIVRTQQGLAYAVGSAAFVPSERGFVVALSQTRGLASITATQSILKINGELQNTTFTPAEVQAAKETLINQYIQNFTTPQQITGATMNNEYYGFPSDYLETYPKSIAKVTPEDVERVAKTYLQPDKATILMVGDLSTFEKPIAVLGKAQEIRLEDYTLDDNSR